MVLYFTEPCRPSGWQTGVGGKAAKQPLSCNKYTYNTKPRVAIYTHQTQKSWYIETLSNRDCVAIQTKINNRDTIIASIYLDIKDEQVTPDRLHKLLQYTNDKRTAIILCIDSNCHSDCFGIDNNKRGEKLEEFIATYHLTIENVGTEYTYETSQAKTIIDITL